MPIPAEIANLIKRLLEEFDLIEQDTTQGLTIVNRNLAFFPNNIILTQYFAYLNTVLLAVDTYRRQVQGIIEIISPRDVPQEVIQEAGEDLGLLLGRVLETKIAIRQIVNRLQE